MKKFSALFGAALLAGTAFSPRLRPRRAMSSPSCPGAAPIRKASARPS